MAEINYYLRANVGCVKQTFDRKNYVFTSEATPGIIYLPPLTDWKRPPPPAVKPVDPLPETPVPAKRSGIWFGFGAQGGGHLAVVGKDTVEALLFSLESYQDRFFMNIDGYRVGPGLGGSIGVVFVVATGGRTPSVFQHLKVSGGDFQANMGGRWGDLAKGLKQLKMISKFANAGRYIDKAISVAEWEKIRDLIYNAIKAGSINGHSATPEVNVMGIPGAGVGVEISLYYGWGEVQVHNQTASSEQ
jgi:hypothetical protein